ncbi:MAG: ATP synthase F1 subunit epsilon [Acidimicrobiales bacterium]
MALEVQLVSPERILYSGDATMVVCRTIGGGDVAFLTGHTNFIGALAIHPVRVLNNGNEQVAAVHGGFVEVSNDRVTILSDVAELPDQISVERAEAAKETAEARLRDDPDDEDAAAALSRAEVRLQVAGAS